MLSIISCSDKLTESKVKKLVDECLEKKPSYGTSIIETGKLKYIGERLETFNALQEKGLLNIEKREIGNVYYKQTEYLISLTDKAKPFIIESKDYYSGNTQHIVRLYTFKLSEIGAIQEIPAMNAADVGVTYKKEDKTPFYDILEKDKTDFKTKKIMIKKTENKGWVYCD